ncbi:MAG: hypothetical protein HY301_14110 [Verrucomicrobia bacterium]|nr:hypothetical protein [Verrucomicrobiota bacterium]
MSAAVLYFNRGTSCYVRLLTSVLSLRKHYSGPVKLMQEGELHEPIASVLRKLRVEVRQLPPSTDGVLVAKSALWRRLEDDHVMYLDADTIVRGPVAEFLDWTREWGFVATWFNGWRTDGGMMRRRLEEWAKVAPELVAPAVAFGKAINSGIQGWSRGADILPRYEELTRRGADAKCKRIILDEIALQLLLPQHRHFVADHAWNTSGVFGDVKRARILHYHGRKHCLPDNPRCDVWKDHYAELLASFPAEARALGEAWGDKRLAQFQDRTTARRKNLTIVTAVDPAYADQLKKNFRAWMKIPGLKGQQFLVFVNGFARPRDRAFLNLPNVKVVRWNYPHAGAGRREFMLAAFLLGVAKHVRTDYWMKLDADCQPQRRWWEWPDYENHSVVSHRWGFTRMKGDSATKHWFNWLDEVFSPQQPRFPAGLDPVHSRISHLPGNPHGLPMRFNSFCHLERTAFTRRMAAQLEAKCGGRLAIPSQDTTSWYCATLWGERIKLLNMKRWFKN